MVAIVDIEVGLTDEPNHGCLSTESSYSPAGKGLASLKIDQGQSFWSIRS